VADANAYFESDQDQAAMRDLYRQRWQYSHLAALFEITSHRDRVIFCDHCDGIRGRGHRRWCGVGRGGRGAHRRALTFGQGEATGFL
jgi:hypothetical protein